MLSRRAVARALAALPGLAAIAFNEAASASPVRANKPLVMLDPGHGGMDPGAIGVSGTYEKYIAINTALELRHQLEASGRYRVAMTRTNDVFIPLEQRVAYAQHHGASLFVSMHADAIGNPSVRGASVYTLATHSSDALSAMLAQSENAADRFAKDQPKSASPEVANILASLVRRETRTESALMQKTVVEHLAKQVNLLVNPARHAGFIVLESATIPSVLVEMGFMSNKQDEALLRQPAHRAVVAAALHGAVDHYFTSVGNDATMAG